MCVRYFQEGENFLRKKILNLKMTHTVTTYSWIISPDLQHLHLIWITDST